jgi:aminoglycoside 6'-N-acetyltransferase I
MNLLYIAGLLTLALGGSGALSVDHYLSTRSKAQTPEPGRPSDAGSMVGETDIRIKLARLSDRDQLVRLRVALWPKPSAEEHARELTQILEGKAPVRMPLIILVAEASDRTLAGFLEIDLRSHADGCNPSRPVGYIEGWYVAENYRHRGIGRRLLAVAEDWARSQACVEIASDTWIDNEVSQRVHEALGYEVVDRCVHFRKTL